MKKFVVISDGLEQQYEVEADNEKEAFIVVNGWLSGELEKIQEVGGEINITEI